VKWVLANNGDDCCEQTTYPEFTRSTLLEATASTCEPFYSSFKLGRCIISHKVLLGSSLPGIAPISGKEDHQADKSVSGEETARHHRFMAISRVLT
jgi:hypothetical protein